MREASHIAAHLEAPLLIENVYVAHVLYRSDLKEGQMTMSSWTGGGFIYC